jgi:hypothetical protein
MSVRLIVHGRVRELPNGAARRGSRSIPTDAEFMDVRLRPFVRELPVRCTDLADGNGRTTAGS